ncbi:DUF6443 domain-containing protein [Mucilaginibacter psychrotolerans]|uniref:DUF6443 domain-containing protein n=1 Tax=Mucilaginibacter psychrotolerans TaxID=1524096 RepID=A0A4Y8S3T6_9SPHI|nr:DUF6443 domain-containing protein [Mucilaginibacter psychrotolerans]TFF33315.1 hypothetical protein E2R66_26620 [Mucilaginibacter psychrotolerans]
MTKPAYKLILLLASFGMLVIGLNANAQPNISYPGGSKSATVGVPLSPIVPTNTGSAVPAINFGQTSTFSGSGTTSDFNHPIGLVADQSGNIYVADRLNYRIRKITPSGIITTIAGSGVQGSANGTGTAASFGLPNSVAVDAAGNIFVADGFNNMIRKITTAGVVTTFAGSTTAGYVNGTGTAARFNNPFGIAIDGSGNLYVAEAGNHTVRKITTAGVVTTWAGNGTAGFVNGNGSTARFNLPLSVATDSYGRVYVADGNNNAIRMIDASGYVSTLAGSGSAGSANGYMAAATFNHPAGIAVDNAFNVYVGDEVSNKIRRISPDGNVITLSGTGTSGSSNGASTTSSFYYPCGVAVYNGNVYVADYNNNLIRQIAVTGYAITPSLPLGLVFDGATGTISGTATEIRGSANYIVTATNGAGTGSTMLSLISRPGAAPAGAGMSNAINVGTLNLCQPSYSSVKSNVSGNYFGNNYSNTNTGQVSGQPADDIWYKFSVENTSEISLSTCGSPFDTYVHLLDATGALIAENDDNGVLCTGTAGSLKRTLQAGVYYFVVEGFGNATGNITTQLNFNNASNPQDMNFVSSWTPRTEVNNYQSLKNLGTNKDNVNIATIYYDGLGRTIQSVQKQGTPGGLDIVVITAYDETGKESIKYLPYVAPSCLSDGSFKYDAISQQKTFYANPSGGMWNLPGITSNNSPVIPVKIENSSLNRTLEEGAPGDPWQLYSGTIPNSGHTVKSDYTSNLATASSGTNFDVALYNVSIDVNGNRTLSRPSNWTALFPAGQLYVSVEKNEQWVSGKNGTIEEYTDKNGRLILSRQFNYNTVTSTQEVLSTYYVYDDFGNLSYVLTPKMQPDDQVAIPQTTLDELGYQYQYDARQRMIGKKIPGKAWEYILYNKIDQVVANQDGVQRNKLVQEYTFTKYDRSGRTVMTGIGQISGASGTDLRASLKAEINANANLWEAKQNSGSGYTLNAWPTTVTNVLAINYYDNYNFYGLPSAYMVNGSSNLTHGVITATRTSVLNAPATLLTVANMLWDVNYYEPKGKISTSISQHYYGGVFHTGNFDRSDFSYDFSNQLKTSLKTHYIYTIGTSALVISNTYTYDHMGRKLTNTQRIDKPGQTGVPVILTSYEYNALGNLMTKRLHSTNGSAYLQSINVTYNERGWLTRTNSQLFDEQLRYNLPTKGAAALFNGNIAEAEDVINNGASKWVTYQYDDLNRLRSGTSSAGYSETDIRYDKSGNITDLTRAGVSMQYIYANSGKSNRLLSTTGLVTGSFLFDVNGTKYQENTINNGVNKNVTITPNILNLPQVISGTTNAVYTYDAKGRKLRRTSGGEIVDYINGIQYYNNTLDFVTTEEGRAINSTNFNYEYTLQDHLGNNRVTFDTQSGSAVIRGQNYYYPFGLSIQVQLNAANKYLFNGKEYQNGINEYDYGRRFYDPVIARWNGIDNLAEKHSEMSPYTFSANNPFNLIDNDGDDWWYFIKEGKTVYYKDNLKTNLIHALNSQRNWVLFNQLNLSNSFDRNLFKEIINDAIDKNNYEKVKIKKYGYSPSSSNSVDMGGFSKVSEGSIYLNTHRGDNGITNDFYVLGQIVRHEIVHFGSPNKTFKDHAEVYLKAMLTGPNFGKMPLSDQAGLIDSFGNRMFNEAASSDNPNDWEALGLDKLIDEFNKNKFGVKMWRGGPGPNAAGGVGLNYQFNGHGVQEVRYKKLEKTTD